MGTIMEILKDFPLSAVLRERLVDKDAEIAALKAEIAVLKAANAALKAENATLKAENENLHIQLQKIDRDKTIQGDPCPYCQQPSGKLNDIRPDKIFGDLGLKIQYYKCQNCGKEYDKEQDH